MDIKTKLSLFFCIFFLSVNCEILELETLEDLRNLISNSEAVSIFFYSHLLPATTPLKSKYCLNSNHCTYLCPEKAAFSPTKRKSCGKQKQQKAGDC